MSRTRTPAIRKGPAAAYAATGEAIYEFTDGQSGGLIGIRRPADGPWAGKLIVEVYRADADVIVRGPVDTMDLEGLAALLGTDTNTAAGFTGHINWTATPTIPITEAYEIRGIWNTRMAAEQSA
jgi:hypothetical protein